MKKINSFYLMLLVLVVGFSSCKKTLEETPYSFLTDANFYTNASAAESALSGVYNEFWDYGLMKQGYWLIDLDQDHSLGQDWFLGTIGSGNPSGWWGINNIWANHYTLIARANSVLENIDRCSMTEIERNRIKGELYFLRGWSYYDLVRLYGEVPIRLKSVANGEPRDKAKSTVAEVFSQVLSDFKKGDSLMYYRSSSNAGGSGHVDKGVAEGFIAEAYLTMGSGSLSGAQISVQGGTNNASNTYTKDVVDGYSSFNSKACFDSAKVYSAKVINSGEYTLFTDFLNIWKVANRNLGENMWEINALDGNTSLETNLTYYFGAATYDLTNRGAVWMTDNCYNTYEHKDQRILEGVTHQYSVNYGNASNTSYIYYPESDSALYAKDATGNTYSYNSVYYDAAYVRKFEFVTTNSTSFTDAYYPMMRYSEVLLMYAEAENEINGPTSDAYKYLNMVRERSKASDAPSGMDQEEFRSFVLAERGREFCLEGKRRYDLLRWGIYLPVMNALGTVQQGSFQISKVRSKKNLLFPISTDEINSNQLLGGNNYGW